VRSAFVALLALLLAAIPAAASAKFTRVTTPAAMSISAGTLAAPKNVTVPATSSGHVAVSWTASSGAPATTGYYVTRKTGSTTSAACSTSATTLLSTTSCTDTVTTSGSYTYTVIAVFHSWTATTSASSTVVVNIASAGSLNFTQNPQSNKSGLGLGNVIVQLLGPGGATLTTSGVPITITLSNNTTSGALSGTKTVNTSNGTATFSALSVDKAGSYTLTASATSYAPDTSSSFTITAGQAANLTVVSGSGQSASRGHTFSNPLVVLVTDAAGNPVSGTTVNYTAPSSGASGVFANNNSAYNDASDATGLASLTFTANSTAGTYNVTAVGAGDSVSFSLTNS
jgi:hypothetical protein